MNIKLGKFKILLLSFLIFSLLCCEGERIEKQETTVNKEPLFIINEGKKYGFINSRGQIVIEPKFDYAEEFSEGMAKFKKIDGSDKGSNTIYHNHHAGIKGKWGYINIDGKVVLNPQYIKAWDFSDGLGLVLIKYNKYKDEYGYGEYRYIDKSGKFVIINKFHNANSFKEGLARVEVIISKKSRIFEGFIDKKGVFAIEPKFDFAGDFSEGLARVGIYNERTNGVKFGFIDKKGIIVIKPQFDYVSDFKDGFSRVIQGIKYNGDRYPNIDLLKNNDERVIRKGEYGFINNKGDLITDTVFDGARKFSEGMAAVKVGDKWGFINNEGRVIVKPIYIEVEDFSDGLAFVNVGNSNPSPHLNKNYGYITKEGNMLIKPKYRYVRPFSEGFALVSEININAFYFIDKSGEKAFEPKFKDQYIERITPKNIFDNLPADRKLHLLSMGYLDDEGNFHRRYQLTPYFNSFKNGLAHTSNNYNQIGYIDKTGKVVWEFSGIHTTGAQAVY